MVAEELKRWPEGGPVWGPPVLELVRHGWTLEEIERVPLHYCWELYLHFRAEEIAQIPDGS